MEGYVLYHAITRIESAGKWRLASRAKHIQVTHNQLCFFDMLFNGAEGLLERKLLMYFPIVIIVQILQNVVLCPMNINQFKTSIED